MRRAMAISAGGAISAAALIWASSFIADAFDHQPALGDPMITIGGVRLYAPWQIFVWHARWSEAYPRPFAIGGLIVLVSFITACVAMAFIMRRGHEMKPFAPGAWGDFEEAKASGLFAPLGAVLGKLDGEILCFDGPEHQLLIGASRSGKGRGHVVPTLLAWPHSALVLDIKGELADGDDRHDFPGTAGFRETLGPVLRFAPTHADSHAFNPLLEVRRGADEVRDGWSINLQGMQGADPAGASGLSDQTDLHLDRLIGAIGTSAIISVVANNAEDEDDGASLSQNIADAAAQEAARTGGRIIDRELQVRPTLRVRAGAPVRVLVMRDIGLRPYRESRNDGR